MRGLTAAVPVPLAAPLWSRALAVAAATVDPDPRLPHGLDSRGAPLGPPGPGPRGRLVPRRVVFRSRRSAAAAGAPLRARPDQPRRPDRAADIGIHQSVARSGCSLRALSISSEAEHPATPRQRVGVRASSPTPATSTSTATGPCRRAPHQHALEPLQGGTTGVPGQGQRRPGSARAQGLRPRVVQDLAGDGVEERLVAGRGPSAVSPPARSTKRRPSWQSASRRPRGADPPVRPGTARPWARERPARAPAG